MVKEYLSSLKNGDRLRWATDISNELGYYIE